MTSDNGYLIVAGSVLNIAGNYFDAAIAISETDLKALRIDWYMQAGDIKIALGEENKKLKKSGAELSVLSVISEEKNRELINDRQNSSKKWSNLLLR